jgi:hypothetical protein
MKEVLGWVRDFVKKDYAAGTKDFSVADICFVATYSTLEAAGLVDLTEVFDASTISTTALCVTTLGITSTSDQCYKTFYGHNYIAIGITHSKS